ATVSSDADVGVLLLDNGKQDQIQNGPNDGFLLYDSCHKKVVQYISYEGEIAPLIPYTNSRSKHIGVYEIAELDTTALFLQGNLQVRESQVWKKGRKTPALINPGLVTYNDAKATLTGTIFTEASMCLTPLPMQMSITLNQIGPDGILDTEDDVFFSVPTALDGSFIMRNLLPGTYMLYLNLPAGHAIDEDQPRPIILSGAATSIQQFCVHQVTTSQQESDIDAVTVAQQAGNIQVHTSPQMHRIVVYNHLGQAERHTCASFQTQMQGILQLEIVTEDGCYRRKIWVE
ncbi:MAG TPA: hypothetical protein VL947_13725, partial [Cytophagales bacterium]|nr:hypothetical protein [Cytophagales bacterium]